MNNNNNKLKLIFQSYNEKNEDRQNELNLCIISNLENDNIDQVINLCEGNNDDYLPDLIKKHNKYKCISGHNRLTYKIAFDYANNNFDKNQLIVLVNTDIMLDSSINLDNLNNVLVNDKKVVLANARHEYDIETGKYFMDPIFAKVFHSNTQDAWFFKTPIIVDDVDFEMGLVGCDNAIADRLSKCGYKVFNMPIQFKIIHVDSLRGKNSQNFKDFHQKNNNNNKFENKHPEEKGQLLVPNYDVVKNIPLEHLLQMVSVNDDEKVWIFTKILSEKIKIKNT